MGPRFLHTECHFTARSCELSSKFASSGREKTGHRRPCHGIFCPERDHQFSLVTTNSRDDNEYGPFNGAGRMDSDCHWEVDKSIEGVIDSSAGVLTHFLWFFSGLTRLRCYSTWFPDRCLTLGIRQTLTEINVPYPSRLCGGLL
jgi:hypothetical protein